MSWKAASMPDLRKAFMERLAHDEHTSLSTLCREFGVSRTTAYKWQSRYDPDDAASLHDQMQDRSRAPRNHPNATSQAVEEGLLRVRRAHPTWGPRKIIAYLSKKDPDQPCPAASTVGQILKTNGLVPARTKKRLHPDGPRPLWKDGPFNAPNALWTIDFKGQFQTLDGQWCYPLTLMDYHSRYLLCGQAFARIDGEDVQRVMEAAFREYGLPLAIKSDNGPPFGAPGVARLSRLGVWWLRLGVQLYPNRPASPQDNAAHERFHRTLLADTATPPQATRRCQQRAFLAYGAVYNNERPHEALDMRTPSDVYIPPMPPMPPMPPRAPSRNACPTFLFLMMHCPATFFPTAACASTARKSSCPKTSQNLAKQYVACFPVSERLSVVCYGPLPLNVFDENKTAWVSKKEAEAVLADFAKTRGTRLPNAQSAPPADPDISFWEGQTNLL